MDERAVRTRDRSSAALAAENERLQRALRARLEEERALRRVATLVAQQHTPETVLAVVTEEVARHLAARAAMTARYDGPGRATVVADWGAPGVAPFPVGTELEIGPETALARVYATRAPARVDSYEGMPGEHPAILRELGMKASVAAPILVEGHLWGAVAAASTAEPFTPDSEARLGAFAELVAQAIANVDARLQLRESRVRIVAAADEARRRIERDLHDGAQQRLVSLTLQVRMARARLEREPDSAGAFLDHLAQELGEASAELRDLARGIHPALLSERGLGPAIEALVARVPMPVDVLDVPDERLPSIAETTAYFTVAEALTNVAKYAQASRASVRLACEDGQLLVEVRDDGVGGARAGAGSGLTGLADRVGAVDGTLTVDSPPGKGTVVRAVMPLEC